jgi:hypothetical protein
MGSITLDGDVRATGSAGGNVGPANVFVKTAAGNGGFGSEKGGDGGPVAAAGDGGNGGTITIKASRGALTITKNHVIAADGGAGGNQFGKGGNGGNSGDTPGKGGDVKKQGDGGNGGTITIRYNRINLETGTKSLVERATRSAGKKGAQQGKGGAPGIGQKPAKHGTVDRLSARNGNPGHLTINGRPIIGGRHR